MPARGNDNNFIENKPRESGSRGYQQVEIRLGDKRVRTEAEAANRKTAEKRGICSGSTRTRDRRQPESQEQLQHLEKGDWKTLRDYKDWGEYHVNNHRRWPRGNEKSERTYRAYGCIF